MHAVIKIIFYIDHIKNADIWVAAILDMQISKCNVISGYVKILWQSYEKVINRQMSVSRTIWYRSKHIVLNGKSPDYAGCNYSVHKQEKVEHTKGVIKIYKYLPFVQDIYMLI